MATMQQLEAAIRTLADEAEKAITDLENKVEVLTENLKEAQRSATTAKAGVKSLELKMKLQENTLAKLDTDQIDKVFAAIRKEKKEQANHSYELLTKHLIMTEVLVQVKNERPEKVKEFILAWMYCYENWKPSQWKRVQSRSVSDVLGMILRDYRAHDQKRRTHPI